MNIKERIIWWNSNFPLDYWYRQKYSIPFNSKQHKEIRVIDIAFEYKESKLMDEVISNIDKNKENHENYINNNVWYKGSVMSEEDEEELYDSIDLSKL